MSIDLMKLDPVPELLRRVATELPADFSPHKPMRLSRAPGRLDVMGGIADYTGSLVCEATLDRAAAVATQRRDDRLVRVMSFNLLDEHVPFTWTISLDALAEHSIADLSREFNQPGRRWAGYIAGCLAILHEQGFVDLKDQRIAGINVALYSTVPLGAGVSSSAAIEVAAMMNFAAELGLARSSDSSSAPNTAAPSRALDRMMMSALCQQVENRVVGAPCGIMDQVSSCAGEADSLLRMVCQPHQLQPALRFPVGIRAVGINSNVRHSVGGGMYGKTRCAAFMAHAIILRKMRDMGAAAGKDLLADPMNGYLANLDADDYKQSFRSYLPASISGAEFIQRYERTIDQATTVAPGEHYHVQQAADHHVLEARRVRNFVHYLEETAAMPAGASARKLPLDKAGHLMYASHISYTNDALLGADECDLLVALVREREGAGLYGAKITGGGSGGTVAVLCDQSARADAAITEIMAEYQTRTGRQAQAFNKSSPGAWAAGTHVVAPI